MIFDYEKKAFEPKEILLNEENKKYNATRIEFDSFIQTQDPEANIVIGYVYEPFEKKTSEILIFLHGMGNRNLMPLSWFPKKFAENGITSYLMVLPYHFERTPKGMKSGKKYLVDDMDDTLLDFKHAVIDTRSSMDYLERKFNTSKFALMGFSFGGMIGTIAMGIDERFQKGIFVVTGGNFLYTTWDSLATKAMRQKYQMQSNLTVYGCTRQKCSEVRKNYKEYLEKLKTPQDVERVPYPKKCLLFDPLTYTHFVKGRKVILYSAFFDEIMPRRASEALWEEMGYPERHWLPADHFTSIAFRNQILKRGVRLLIDNM